MTPCDCYKEVANLSELNSLLAVEDEDLSGCWSLDLTTIEVEHLLLAANVVLADLLDADFGSGGDDEYVVELGLAAAAYLCQANEEFALFALMYAGLLPVALGGAEVHVTDLCPVLAIGRNLNLDVG